MMKKELVAALAFGSCLAAAGDGVPGWKAGVARVKITPKEMVWLAGYGSRNRPPEGVRHDVWAKALALEDAKGHVGVILTIDVCTVDKAFTDELLGRLAKYGIDRTKFILNCSHTHTGPAVGRSLQHIHQMDEAEWAKEERYTHWLMDALDGLVGDACARRAPAKVSTGCGQTRFAVNRRHNRPEARIPEFKEIKGPADYSVPVMKVEDAKGGIMAILFGYACHPTVLADYLYSGDYAGFAQIEIEKAYPGAVAMFFQGAGADLNPLPRRKASLAKQYGTELAAAVEQALSEDMDVREPALQTSYEEVLLPMEKPLGLAELKKIGSNPDPDDYYARWARAMVRDIESGKVLPEEWPFPVQYWAIGAQKLFALGGELMVGYAIEIKRRYGEDSFVMGYCNDVMNYIPTPEAWDEGGYEVEHTHSESGLPAGWTREVTKLILDAVGRAAARGTDVPGKR